MLIGHVHKSLAIIGKKSFLSTFLQLQHNQKTIILFHGNFVCWAYIYFDWHKYVFLILTFFFLFTNPCYNCKLVKWREVTSQKSTMLKQWFLSCRFLWHYIKTDYLCILNNRHRFALLNNLLSTKYEKYYFKRSC